MDSLQLLWEMMLAFIQLMGIMWPVVLLPVIMLFIKLGTRIYKNRRYAKAGIKDIDKLNGEAFEEYLAVLFKKLGYQVKRTPYQGDFGADLIIKQDNEKTVVQAKRYKRTVGVKAVQEAVASKEYYRCDKAMVVTNSYFSQQAKALAKANRVELWDRDTLVSRLLSVKEPESVEVAPSTNEVTRNQAEQQLVNNDQVVPTCAQCGKPVSAKVQEYCAAHTDVFQGLIYCYEHQKEMRKLHAVQ